MVAFLSVRPVSAQTSALTLFELRLQWLASDLALRSSVQQSTSFLCCQAPRLNSRRAFVPANSSVYPFFRFVQTAEDPYTFRLTFWASLVIWVRPTTRDRSHPPSADGPRYRPQSSAARSSLALRAAISSRWTSHA